MRRVVTGEQVARIYNPDPFARPVFRAPVYRTPAGLILAAWLVKLIARLARLVFRHPVAAVVLAVLGFMWVSLGWIGPAALAAWAVAVLVIWRCYWPGSFARWVITPARGTWRAFAYRRRWPAVMTIANLAPFSFFTAVSRMLSSMRPSYCSFLSLSKMKICGVFLGPNR